MQHPEIGAKILEPVDFLHGRRALRAPSPRVVRRQRQRGYPLAPAAASRIPLPSRMILVADTVEAMTSDRPYRLDREGEDLHPQAISGSTSTSSSRARRCEETQNPPRRRAPRWSWASTPTPCSSSEPGLDTGAGIRGRAPRRDRGQRPGRRGGALRRWCRSASSTGYRDALRIAGRGLRSKTAPQSPRMPCSPPALSPAECECSSAHRRDRRLVSSCTAAGRPGARLRPGSPAPVVASEPFVLPQQPATRPGGSPASWTPTFWPSRRAAAPSRGRCLPLRRARGRGLARRRATRGPTRRCSTPSPSPRFAGSGERARSASFASLGVPALRYFRTPPWSTSGGPVMVIPYAGADEALRRRGAHRVPRSWRSQNVSVVVRGPHAARSSTRPSGPWPWSASWRASSAGAARPSWRAPPPCRSRFSRGSTTSR